MCKITSQLVIKLNEVHIVIVQRWKKRSLNDESVVQLHLHKKEALSHSSYTHYEHEWWENVFPSKLIKRFLCLERDVNINILIDWKAHLVYCSFDHPFSMGWRDSKAIKTGGKSSFSRTNNKQRKKILSDDVERAKISISDRFLLLNKTRTGKGFIDITFLIPRA